MANTTTESIIEVGLDGETSSKIKYRFAVIPKQLSSPFFDVVHAGCLDKARKLGNVECIYDGPEKPDPIVQAKILTNLASSGNIHGIAVAIAEASNSHTIEAINFAIDLGIPVITFDSDDNESERLVYIGTNNFVFGEHLGKVLLQIDPSGGSYGVISTRATNAVIREDGLRSRLEGSKWVPNDHSSADCKENEEIAVQKMEEFFQGTPDLKAIISMGGWPMRNVSLWTDFIDRHPNITTVCADNLQHQMELLDEGYVSGLVGQVPFQMGVRAIEVLQGHVMGVEYPSEVYGTVLQEIITVPLDLGEAAVDTHQIGNLKYLGFSFATVISILSIGFALWTFRYRSNRVVQASQPSFLIMIAAGAFLFGSSMIAMSFDDENALLDTQRPVVVGCTSQIWLLSIGFTTVFSALFSKTWRINLIWHNPVGFRRMKVSARDVIKPFMLLLTANVLTLTFMTVMTPLEFVRHAHRGTDDWNRDISTYGICESNTGRPGGALPYIVTILLINSGTLLVALYQAYQARSIQSEFSESHYIAIVMFSMLQAVVIAGPLLVPLREYPELAYILKVSMVFIIAAVILLCIFVPKMISAHFTNPVKRNRGSIKVSFDRGDSSDYCHRRGSLQRNGELNSNDGLRLAIAVTNQDLIREDALEGDENGLRLERSGKADLDPRYKEEVVPPPEPMSPIGEGVVDPSNSSTEAMPAISNFSQSNV